MGGPEVDGVAFWVEAPAPVALGDEGVVVVGTFDAVVVGTEAFAPLDGTASPGNVAGKEAGSLARPGAEGLEWPVAWAAGNADGPLLSETTPKGPPPPPTAGWARLGLPAGTPVLLLLPPPPVPPEPPFLLLPNEIRVEAFNGPSSRTPATVLTPRLGAGSDAPDSSPRALGPAGAGSRNLGTGP